MVALEKAFCCLSLRTGNLILGWIHLIFGTILVIALAVLIPMIDETDPKDLPENVSKHDVKVALGILLAVCLISPIMAICHLYGSYKYRKGYLLPYLIGGAIQLFILGVSVIFTIVKVGTASDIISQIISFLIFLYLYLIPWSFYKEIKNDRATAMQRA